MAATAPMPQPAWDHPPGWVPADGAAPGPASRPWASIPTTRAPQPTPEASTRPHLRFTGSAWALLALAALAGLLSLATHAKPQLAVAIAIVAGGAIDALAARYAVSALAIAVANPVDPAAGSPTRWRLRVAGLRRPVSLSPTLLPRPPGVLVDRAEPGLLVLPPATRGVVHHFYVDVHANGPVGLVQSGRRFRVTPPEPVPLGPSSVEVDVDWPTPKAVGFGLSPVAPRGDDLFRAVRPYVRGDERRRIHWKATAHHGELMVRESDGVGIVALQVVVDLGQPGPTAELTAGVAAHVAEEAIRRGWVVQLVTLDTGSVPPPLVQLGSPFGPPPVRLPSPIVPLETQVSRVASATAVRQQLATAAYGRPLAPTWTGLSCVVHPGGVEWP